MILDQAINFLQIIAVIAAAIIAYKAEIKAARIGKLLKEDKKDLPLLLMDLKFFNNLSDIIGGTSKYVRFRFDKAYLEMLKESEIRDKVSINTNTMPESDLKNIYLTENITDSEVYFLKREKIDENNDVIFYCSVATHNGEGYNRSDKTLIKTYIDGVKDLINDHSLTS